MYPLNQSMCPKKEKSIAIKKNVICLKLRLFIKNVCSHNDRVTDADVRLPSHPL